MIAVLKKIALGLALIVVSAAILLYSDLPSRRVTAGPTHAQHQLRVAVVQHADIPTLDDGVSGALAALKERGYSDGDRISVRRYNAQGDIGTANAIAKEVTSSNYDLIFSVSTISLQTIANANRFATPPRTHVFSLVSDPYAVGVGVSRENHLQHPPYMTGYGSLAPVQDAFNMARQLNPNLKRVGLVWDPSEANSLVTTTLARSVCAKMGITLVEANAENSTAIGDAVGSLITRNIDAIWICPDLVAAHGLDLIVSKARVARIPVFTSVPRKTSTGALFELGANYFAIGHTAGLLAADILDGRSPASVPVENIMPVTLQINKLALNNLRDKWTLPDSVLGQADVIEDQTGRHTKSQPTAVASTNP
jgi:ABC-type uncharacterized transport system substrate-binding protein